MAYAAGLAAAITVLTNAIALIWAPAPPVPVFDPFLEEQLFNLSSRAGDQAYTNISAKDMWEGNVSTFPSCIVALRLRAEEGNWNTTAPHSILVINDNNILLHYHSITDTQIEVVRTS